MQDFLDCGPQPFEAPLEFWDSVSVEGVRAVMAVAGGEVGHKIAAGL